MKEFDRLIYEKIVSTPSEEYRAIIGEKDISLLYPTECVIETGAVYCASGSVYKNAFVIFGISVDGDRYNPCTIYFDGVRMLSATDGDYMVHNPFAMSGDHKIGHRCVEVIGYGHFSVILKGVTVCKRNERVLFTLEKT